MRPVFADFGVHPPRTDNDHVRHTGCQAGRAHLKVGAAGSVRLDFTLDEGELPDQAAVTVTALVSLLGEPAGCAPVDACSRAEPRWTG